MANGIKVPSDGGGWIGITTTGATGSCEYMVTSDTVFIKIIASSNQTSYTDIGQIPTAFKPSIGFTSTNTGMDVYIANTGKVQYKGTANNSIISYPLGG